MKTGIILTRKHGAKELLALGPSLPYHLQLEKFKKDFQANADGVHKEFEEVVLVPIEAGVAKRIRFTTAARAKEQAEIHARAVESAKTAATLSDDVKRAMADVADAGNQVEHFERALKSAEQNADKETRTKQVEQLSSRLETARENLKAAKAALDRVQKAEAKAKATEPAVSKPKAEAKAKAETTQTESK